MSQFYIKNNSGEFVPISFENMIDKESLKDKLAIIKVGTEDNPASMESLEATQDSFSQADILNDIQTSIIITPYQIDMGVASYDELEEKPLYIQVTGGQDISGLEESIKETYKNLKSKYKNVTILPTPLKVKDYNHIKETLKRCKIRRKRRGSKVSQ